MDFVRLWGWDWEWGVTFNDSKNGSGGNGNVLRLHCGDSCITLQIY